MIEHKALRVLAAFPGTPKVDRSVAVDLPLGASLHRGECARVIGPRGGVKVAVNRWRVNGKVGPFSESVPGAYQEGSVGVRVP